MGTTLDLVGLRPEETPSRGAGWLLETLRRLWQWTGALFRRRTRRSTPSAAAVSIASGADRTRAFRPTSPRGDAPALHRPTATLSGVPAVAMRLQTRAASAFLERLGGRWIPGVLLERLRTQDVLGALGSFCEDFHLRLASLLDPDAPDHDDHRARLQRVLGLLVSFERVERELGIPLSDVYDTLRRSPDRAEPLIDRLEDVAGVWRFVGTTRIHWPEYRRFHDEVQHAVEHWRTLDDAGLARILTAVKRYQLADTRLTELEDEFARVRLRKNRDRLRPGDRRELNQMDVRAHRILEGLETGRSGIEQVLTELEALLVALHDVVGRAQEVAPRAPRLTLESALEVLGLTTGATLRMARQAYRSLAIRVHPDKHHGSDAQAHGERMRQINVAWDFVKVQLS